MWFSFTSPNMGECYIVQMCCSKRKKSHFRPAWLEQSIFKFLNYIAVPENNLLRLKLQKILSRTKLKGEMRSQAYPTSVNFLETVKWFSIFHVKPAKNQEGWGEEIGLSRTGCLDTCLACPPVACPSRYIWFTVIITGWVHIQEAWLTLGTFGNSVTSEDSSLIGTCSPQSRSRSLVCVTALTSAPAW